MPTYKGPDGRWRFRGVYNGRDFSGSSPKGNNTKAAAARLEQEMLRKLERRIFTGQMPTVAQFSEQFLEYQRTHTKQLTYQLQCQHIRKHVVPHLGTKQVDAVETFDLDQLKMTWSKDAAARTVNSRLGTTLRMFALAKEWRVIVDVPETKALKVAPDTKRFFTEPEASALIDAAHPRWRAMMIVGLYTGLRIGELRGLQWRDVDLQAAQLHVNRTDPGVAGVEANAPKGGKSRTVPLNADALRALVGELDKRRASRKRLSPEGWVWPGVDIWHDQRNRDRPRSEGGCVNAIGSAITGARIKAKPGERLGWHTLRHTYASWLVIRGVPLRVVQDLLGHASIRQTERYAHLAPNQTHHAAVATLEATYLNAAPQRALNDSSDPIVTTDEDE